MADRYRGMRYVPRRELKRFRKDGTAEPHDDLLVELMGAIEGYHTALADRFDREAAAIKADEMLSEKGKRDKLKALAAQYRRHDDLDRHDAVIARAEKVVGELEATATANALPLDLNGLSQDEKLLALIEYANRKGRWLLKYEAAPPEKQREIVWDAIDKAPSSPQARETLRMLRDENCLDPETVRRADLALRRGTHPDIAAKLEELDGGRLFNGEVDPANPGALRIAKLNRDHYQQYLDQHITEVTGAEHVTALAELTEQYGLSPATVTGKTLTLSREAGSNAVIFRAAQAAAQERGLVLEIEPLAEAPFGPNGARGQGGGNG